MQYNNYEISLHFLLSLLLSSVLCYYVGTGRNTGYIAGCLISTSLQESLREIWDLRHPMRPPAVLSEMNCEKVGESERHMDGDNKKSQE